jgi:signal transduction histidine kinase
MATLFQNHRMESKTFVDLIQCSEQLSNAGALLLTEEALEVPHLYQFLESLKAQPAWSELPVIILTSGGESRMAQLLDVVAEAAGSVTLLERPMQSATLLRSIEVALRSRRRQYQVRHLLQQEQSLREKAETANQTKDIFLATVSHELRTPLNAILGWATVMTTAKVDKLDEATAARAIEAIGRNARAQALLIEDLLDLSRIHAGKLRLKVHPVELHSVIKSAVDSVDPAFQAKGVQLEVILNSASVPIAGDEHRLQQVFCNLLSNALQFTPKGGRVQINLKQIQSRAHVTVSDNGDGITPDSLNEIFEPFRQAGEGVSKANQGLGLGLAIVRRLVELHDGVISVKSEGKGKGAEFTVDLPIEPIPDKVKSGGINLVVTANLGTAIATPVSNPSNIKALEADDEKDTQNG